MNRLGLRVVVCLAVLTAGAAAHADKEIGYDELPELVQKTVEREVGPGQVAEIEIDEEDGAEVYEIEFFLDDTKYELDVATDGTLLRRHRD